MVPASLPCYTHDLWWIMVNYCKENTLSQLSSAKELFNGTDTVERVMDRAISTGKKLIQSVNKVL